MSKSPLSLYSSYYIDSKVDSAAVTNYGGIFPYLNLMLLTGDAGISLCMGQIAKAVGAKNRKFTRGGDSDIFEASWPR